MFCCPHQVLDFWVEGQPAPARALQAQEASSVWRWRSLGPHALCCAQPLPTPTPPLQAQRPPAPTCTPAALALNCFCSASSAPNSASMACSRAPLGGSYSCQVAPGRQGGCGSVGRGGTAGRAAMQAWGHRAAARARAHQAPFPALLPLPRTLGGHSICQNIEWFRCPPPLELERGLQASRAGRWGKALQAAGQRRHTRVHCWPSACAPHPMQPAPPEYQAEPCLQRNHLGHVPPVLGLLVLLQRCVGPCHIRLQARGGRKPSRHGPGECWHVPGSAGGGEGRWHAALRACAGHVLVCHPADRCRLGSGATYARPHSRTNCASCARRAKAAAGRRRRCCACRCGRASAHLVVLLVVQLHDFSEKHRLQR